MNAKPSTKRAPTAFVAMCFDTRLEHIYHRVVKPVCEQHGFECRRADEILRPGVVIADVRAEIEQADLLVFDLSFENPNVYYELGMAHVLDQQPILISSTAANIPFDVRHLRVIAYKDDKIGLLNLRQDLVDLLDELYGDGMSRTRKPAPKAAVTVDEKNVQRAALFSSSSELQRFAVRFLGDCRDRESYSLIRDLAYAGRDSDIVREAFTALYLIDPEAALETLLERGLQKQPDFLVRERVVELLGFYEPTSALVDQLCYQTTDSSWGVRRSVCQVLGRWRVEKALAFLQKLTGDPELRVQLAAEDAIHEIQEQPRHLDEPGSPAPRARQERG